MLKLLPPIRIHCWGGFGSQLCAWALYADIERKFQNRFTSLVFHSSGITRREQTPFSLPGASNSLFIDDFVSNRKNNKNIYYLIHTKQTIKWLLKNTGFYAEVNTTYDYNNLKPMVCEIRGHYANREISNYALELILQEIQKYNFSKNYLRQGIDSLALHYRLGDLLTDEIKSFIPAENIIKFINSFSSIWKINDIDVFSDSGSKAAESLGPLELNIQIVDVSPINVINSCLDYKYFIGTNSKLTIWIVLLRLFRNPDSFNAVPLQIKSEIEKMRPNIRDLDNLIYY